MMMDSLRATLLITCPDQKGLVAAIAGFLAQHDANIVDFREHVSPDAQGFFARVVFDLSGLAIARDEVGPAFAPLARRFDMQWALYFSDQPKRMALLVSKYEHCLYDLLIRHKGGELPVTIPAIISNHPDMQPVAEFFKIPYFHVPSAPGGKAAQEAEILRLLAEVQVDFVVMARYMQILSAEFLGHYPHRVINIHHSFLPAFIGGKPYHQAYERGVKLIGATAHYATEELDEGPIIEQNVVRVTHAETVDDLIRMGRDIERIVLARAVHLHADNRILVSGRRTVTFS
ncbi:MAG: Formyltetrahydrofolate deformylase [Cyanobacteria bacterium RYN_339]|nr:Formyltetrahydrofolate deformylase [Cyanobacteria bacterium RYN_339]